MINNVIKTDSITVQVAESSMDVKGEFYWTGKAWTTHYKEAKVYQTTGRATSAVDKLNNDRVQIEVDVKADLSNMVIITDDDQTEKVEE